MSFVFYDTETTGISTSFDQMLQFAAILTEDDLQELDRFEMRCRLEPHVVPSAGAFRVTGMTIDRATDQSLPTHYEMVCQMRDRLLGWCPARFVGWNTLSFDEHLLRQAFYKCLHPPYLTNTNGNERSDILKLAQCVEAFAKDVLVVPLSEKGKPTYSLEKLAPANGFAHLNAHDAMADVEATIFICRLLKQKAPGAWDQLLHCASKSRVVSLINDEPIFILRDYFYSGGLKEYALTLLGDEPNGLGASLAFDLTVDPTQLLAMDDKQLAARLKKSPKLVRKIRPNASPMVTAAEPGEPFGGVSYDTLTERSAFLKSRPDVVERLLQLSAREPSEASEHVEEQIYDGFPSAADSGRMVEFHAKEWCDRYAVTEKFEDKRLRVIGLRLIHCHCPESLPPEIRAEQDRFIASRWTGHGFESPPWGTVDAADTEAAAMQEEGHPDHHEMLSGLRSYLADKRKHAMEVLGLE